MTNTDTTTPTTAPAEAGLTTKNAVTYFEISGPDPSGLRTFYRDGLGLDLGPLDEDDYCMLVDEAGGTPGGLWNGTKAFGGSYAIPFVQVDDLDSWVQRAVDAGATVLTAPVQHGPTRTAHIADPAGNRVGVYQMLG
jgi:predicted enzyme related to lactoylglutathione lyase